MPVKQRIGDKVHRPGFAYRSGRRPGLAVRFHQVAARSLKPHAQRFLLIEAVHPLVIDLSAFAPAAASRIRPLSSLIVADSVVTMRRAIQSQLRASPALVDPGRSIPGTGPIRAAVQAFTIFLQHVLQHLFLEADALLIRLSAGTFGASGVGACAEPAGEDGGQVGP